MNERPKDKTGKTGATDIDPYGSKRIEGRFLRKTFPPAVYSAFTNL